MTKHPGFYIFAVVGALMGALAGSGCSSGSKRQPKAVVSVDPAPRAPEQVVAHYEHAILRVEAYYAGVPTAVGTGFFISDKGHFVTNAHVLEIALGGRTAQYPVVTLKDGQKFSGDQILYHHCSGGGKHDLCLLRVNHQPKAHFAVDRTTPFPKATNIFLLGIPNGIDVLLSRGIIGGYVRWKRGTADFIQYKDGMDEKDFVEHAQITASVSPGASGGPVFTESGAFVGVATWQAAAFGNQNLNFAISAKELRQFLSHAGTQRARTFTETQKAMSADIQKKAREAYQKLAKDELAKVRAGRNLPAKSWKKMSLKVGKRRFQFYAPVDLQCEDGNDEDADGIKCSLSKDGIEGVVWFVSYKKEQDNILARTKKKPEVLPLSITQSLIDSGEWETRATQMSAQEKAKFYNSLSTPKCSTDAGRFGKFLSDWRRCEQRGINMPDPDQAQVYLTVQEPGGKKPGKGHVVEAIVEAEPQSGIDRMVGLAEVMLYSLRPSSK